MKSCCPLILLIVTLLFWGMFSCEGNSKKVEKNLTGKWFLVGKTVPKREYWKDSSGKWHDKIILKPKDKYIIIQDSCSFLTFNNSKDYIKYSRCGDLHQDFKGKYFVLDNPNRGNFTLALVPDISISGADTIRTGYTIMDIANLQGDSLVLIEQTTWLKSDSLPNPRFSYKHTYKRIK